MLNFRRLSLNGKTGHAGSLLSTLFAVFTAAALAQPAATVLHQKDSETEANITIGPGDLLDLSVYHVPELTAKVRVDNNGTVALALIGDLKLAGLSVRDAQAAIAHLLMDRELVLHPQVSVLIEEFATQGVTVYGEVAAPGIYSLLGPHRLYDAIAAAGGLTTRAGRTVSVFHANPEQEVEVLELSPSAMNSAGNIEIHPGDTVAVSKAGVVYVLGEVNKPGLYAIDNTTNLTLMRALSMAGSTTKTASLKHAYILRKTDHGSVQTEVRLDDLYRARSGDVQLQAEDIVFVPLSNLKSYGPMIIQGAIQAAIYAIYAYELHN
jgi:polysaccharide export outer membrane protein